MITFVCKKDTTYETEAWFDKIVLGMIPEKCLKSAKLSYNVEKGLPDYDCKKEEYPLQIFGQLNGEDIKIYIYCVTAGYSGSGPYASFNILKKSGFGVKFEEISKKRESIELKFEK